VNRIFDLKNANFLGILWRISALELGSVVTLAGFCSSIDSYFQPAKQLLILLSQLLEIILSNLMYSLLIFVLINLTISFVLLNIFKKSKQTISETPTTKEILPPKKYMIKILNAVSESEEVVLKGREKEFGLTTINMNKYISILCGYKYMKQTRYFPTPFGGIRHMYYKILPKGSVWLNEND
jgi:hypothetical protein